MRILIVEDDEYISKSLRMMLEKEKYYIKSAFSAKEAFVYIKKDFFDVLLIKYQLPDMNGIKACYYIRKELTTTPIIFLTKRSDIDTKLSAFAAGANDYMVKPFSLLELVARINVHKISEKNSINSSDNLNFDNLYVYPDKNLVYINDKKIKLTHKEVLLLSYLVKNINKIISRKELISHLYADNKVRAINIIDVHVSNVRKKLSKKLCPIQTISGKGYLISKK